MSGVSERLGGKPRENSDDAYATFMDMPQSEWLGLMASLFGGGILTPVEMEGLERAMKDRGPETPRDEYGNEALGVCMNCGAAMAENPMHPWCVDCDDCEGPDVR